MRRWSETLLLALVLMSVLIARPAAAMMVATGSFVGDAAPARAITGVGFPPLVVIIRTEALGHTSYIRTATTTGGSKTLTSNVVLVSGRIDSLDVDGFSVGSLANQTGQLVHWIAFGQTDDGFAVGSYVGDGVTTSIDISDTSNSVDFEADYLILIPETANFPVQALDEGGALISPGFGFSGPLFAGGDVTALTPTGFDVSGGVRTNDNSVGYHYVAWRERAGTEVRTYVGDGAAGDQAVAVPFEPDFVSVTRETCCAQSRYRQDTQGTDESFFWSSSSLTTDAIKSFSPAGFVVGDSADTGSAATYYFVAWQTTGVLSVPALPTAGLLLFFVAIAASCLAWLPTRSSR